MKRKIGPCFGRFQTGKKEQHKRPYGQQESERKRDFEAQRHPVEDSEASDSKNANHYR